MSKIISGKFTDDIEIGELIDKLRNSGYGELVEMMLENESRVYTKKGRLNKSGACRVLGYKTKQLEESLKKCREILKSDIPDF